MTRLLLSRLLALAAMRAARPGDRFFGLSGWFFVYSNSQWFRTYLFLGFIVAFVEWTLGWAIVWRERGGLR